MKLIRCEEHTKNVYSWAVSRLRQLVVGLSPQRPRFVPRSVSVPHWDKFLFEFFSFPVNIVTYQDFPVTQQLNGASLLYSLISATMKTNASS
jgi:hypothetical protein